MRRILLAVTAAVTAVSLWTVTSNAEVLAPVATTTTTSTTAQPTTTTVATTTTITLPRPIDVPTDSYAPEPIVTIGAIEIPKLGLRTELHEGITLHNIDLGPSHWPGSAMPGEVGNVVVMGHRVTHSRPFRHLDSLVAGDEVFFEVRGVRHRYVVTGHDVVTPSQTEIADQTVERTATLFACHPPGSARYRYVVKLKLA